MKFTRKSDIFIIALILAVAFAVYFIYRGFVSKENTYAEIYYDSVLAERIPLSGETETFGIPQNLNVLFCTYPDGSIAFANSDCPDKICINAGRLSYPGESAACLPNKIILKIVSESGDDVIVIN